MATFEEAKKCYHKDMKVSWHGMYLCRIHHTKHFRVLDWETMIVCTISKVMKQSTDWVIEE